MAHAQGREEELCFFFSSRRRHTRCLSDWSSDVCSSDLNLVAEPDGRPGCVLIRALEPVSGLELMQARRGAIRKAEQLANGPGKLTLALGITRAHNGADVTRGSLVVREAAGTGERE